MRAVVTSLALVALLTGIACKGDASSKTGNGSGTGSAAAADPWGTSAAPSAPAEQITRPFLYAATHPDAPGVTTYLFGTMHIGINADTQLPRWVWSKLEGAKAFAMEADVTDPAVMKALARTDGSSIEADLGPAHWQKLKDVLGEDLAKGMNHYKPFAVITVLATRDLLMTAPMDQVMHQRAKSAGKPIVFLETALRQLEIIDAFMTGADIKAYLDNLDYAKAEALATLDYYRKGDAAALGKVLEDQTLWKASGRDPALFAARVDALLGARNASWIAPIEKLHADGGGFVAVGAGHLVGPRSVIQLLGERGFTVTRVTE